MQKDTQCDPIDRKRPEQANPQTESGFMVTGAGGGAWEVTADGDGDSLGG